MKLSQVKRLAPFVQAAAEGKTLQYLTSGGKWIDLNDDSLSLEDLLGGESSEGLRIKPTAREFFVRICPNKEKPEIEEFKSSMPCRQGCEQILVREVIE